jgi:hypothetical protein
MKSILVQEFLMCSSLPGKKGSLARNFEIKTGAHAYHNLGGGKAAKNAGFVFVLYASKRAHIDKKREGSTQIIKILSLL